MAKLRKGDPRLAAPRAAIWFGVVGMAFTTIIGLAAVALSDATQSTYAFNEWLHSMANPLCDHIAAILEELDSIPVIAVILLLGGIILTFGRGWMPALGFMVVTGLGWLLIAVIKEIVREERPTPFDPEFAGHTPSYPSGHTVFAVTLTVAIWAVLKGSKWRAPLVVIGAALTLATAWSRLYLGVHYPIDVIGGILGGISSAVLVIGFWNILFARKKKAAPAVSNATSAESSR